MNVVGWLHVPKLCGQETEVSSDGNYSSSQSVTRRQTNIIRSLSRWCGAYPSAGVLKVMSSVVVGSGSVSPVRVRCFTNNTTCHSLHLIWRPSLCVPECSSTKTKADLLNAGRLWSRLPYAWIIHVRRLFVLQNIFLVFLRNWRNTENAARTGWCSCTREFNRGGKRRNTNVAYTSF